MFISDLVLETTRKCNLRMTMSNEVLNAALDNCSGISTVTFGGGEPSLAPEVFENFISLCIWIHISFGSFYIVTNGKAHNGLSKFMKLVDRLYDFADDKEACQLVVSQDQYHKALREVNWSRYEVKDEKYGWEELPPYFNKKGRESDIINPLNEGRAIETGVGWKEPEQQQPFDVEEYRDGELCVRSDNANYVYIAANGNVVSGCNMSFRRIDKESKGNVLQTSLQSIIESYCVREDTEEAVSN